MYDAVVDEQSFQVLRGAAFVVALAAGMALERAAPHARLRPAWRTNLGLWAVNAAVIGLACGACACTVARWAEDRGVGILRALAVPSSLALVATVLALDAVSYAWHRANHRVPFLWRFHRVHHADRDFHVSTALRFHPGELLLSLPIRLAAVVILGAPVAGVLAFEAVFAFANILEHGNFDLPRGFERVLSVAFVTPALHRWHHSREVRELDSNFGTVLTIWDRAFRTLQWSDSGRRIVTGLPGGDGRPSLSGSLSGSLAAPFRR
ncbi:MAG TPA: sterol desaturase family protein [Candidatus Binatia bacterium]|nr:sterol desaturase family protein [Candidatus Binatia bacterium]